MALVPGVVAGQGPVPARNNTDLFVLDLAATPLGEISTSIKQLKGILEVVMKDGAPMLKACASITCSMNGWSASRGTWIQFTPGATIPSFRTTTTVEMIDASFTS